MFRLHVRSFSGFTADGSPGWDVLGYPISICSNKFECTRTKPS